MIDHGCNETFPLIKFLMNVWTYFFLFKIVDLEYIHVADMYAALQRPSMNSYYRQPTYNSSGNLHHGYSRAPVPNFINPMVSSSNRSHQDYLKYASGSNVSYNPYQTTNINPSLMARPTIEPFQNTNISQSVADAIARGRDTSLYSSVRTLRIYNHMILNFYASNRKNN